MKAIVTIIFGLGILMGLQGCKDKQSEYEPTEPDTPAYTIPEEEEQKIELEDEPAEETLPYEEQERSDEPEEVPEIDPEY